MLVPVGVLDFCRLLSFAFALLFLLFCIFHVIRLLVSSHSVYVGCPISLVEPKLNVSAKFSDVSFSAPTHPAAMTSYILEPLAYLKVVLHSAKYPTETVTGLLIGSQSSDGVVSIKDAIPLLHHWTDLSPMMEAGLQLVSSYIFNGLLSSFTDS